MNARHRTLFWLALLGLGLVTLVLQMREPAGAGHDHADHDAAGEAPAEALFAALPEERWAAMDLLVRGVSHRFERQPGGAWILHRAMAGEAASHGHAIDAEAARRIGEVMATFARTRIDRRLPPQPERLANFGLDNPEAILMISGTDGRPLAQLEIGALGVDGLGRYLRLPRDGSLMIIANYQVQGVLGLLPPSP